MDKEKNKTAAGARMMPHNIEAEQAVLGCNLIDDQICVTVMTRLKADDFYTGAHNAIFEAMNKIYNERKPIDFVTLTDELTRTGSLESVGGIDYITTLTNIVPSAANADHYIDIVKRDSVFRSLIKQSSGIIEKAYSDAPKEEVIGFAEQAIFDISQKDEISNLVEIGRPLEEVIAKLDLIARDKNALKGLETGFRGLDKITRGLQKSDLILLAARPGVGKTSFAMNVVAHAALKNNKKCAVFSLEMPKTQIAQRALFSTAGISMSKGLNGELTGDEWKPIMAANKKLSESNIFIDDSSMSTPIEILRKCRWLKMKHGLDLVMIDYLQLMNGMGGRRNDNRQQEISELTRNLKITARELDVPIILISQLSRATETRKGDHRPILSDLRESGSIEQDADIVLFLYNPELYNDIESEDEPGICELIVAKHRNGETGTIKLRWVGELVSYLDIDNNTYKNYKGTGKKESPDRPEPTPPPATNEPAPPPDEAEPPSAND